MARSQQDHALHQHPPLQLDEDHRFYFCIPCRRKFTSRGAAIEHAKSNPKHSECFCDHCQRLFWSPYALVHHLATSIRHVSCSLCSGPTSFITLREFQTHVEEEHNQCLKCAEVLDDAISLQAVRAITLDDIQAVVNLYSSTTKTGTGINATPAIANFRSFLT